MSQRKLVGALSILLLAILFIAVGCGDGKHSSKTRINNKHKNVPRGKPKGAQPPKPGSPEHQAKVAAFNTIDAEVRKAESATAVQQLPDGNYELESIVSYAAYIKGSQDFKVLKKYSVRDGKMTLSENPLGAGLVSNFVDDGREILLSSKMTVTGGIAPDSRQNVATALALKTSVGTSPKMTMELTDEPIAPHAGIELAISDLLNQSKTPGGAALKTFPGGKLVTAIALQADNKITIRVTEEKNKAETFVRNLFFVYRLQQPTQPQPQQSEPQQQQPGTADGEPRVDDGEQQPQGWQDDR